MLFRLCLAARSLLLSISVSVPLPKSNRGPFYQFLFPPTLPRTMVTLVVAATNDPASIGPATAFLAMPGWSSGPTLPEDMVSYRNGEVRLLKHDKNIMLVDDLDRRWEEATGEIVDEVIFLCQHNAATSRPALTVHPLGVPHLRDDEVPYEGGRPGWAGLPSPRVTPWLRLMKSIAEEHGLLPEFEVTLECTHHGPVVGKPTMFVEIGSSDEYWRRQDAAQVIALVLWKGLGMEGGSRVGDWNSGGGNKVLFGLGGGHYVPNHMKVAWKEGVWTGHMLAGHSLRMEEPNSNNGNAHHNDIGGTWKHSINASYEATKLAFPGGEIIAHLDQKSFKSWQKKVITSYLGELNIKIGKPADFP